MVIGIDARFVGPQGTGLGKYTEKLIQNLQNLDKKNQYLLFLKKENWDYLEIKNKNFSKVQADIPWYSLKEQQLMPKIFSKQNLDILHVPHFNVPIFYRGKFIVTIHDLIHHRFSQESATTKNILVFKLKRFAYKKIINHAVNKSEKIIVPSNFVKEDIIKTFNINPNKIIVTYEAAEEEYLSISNFKFPISNSAKNIKKPFIIYVGNAYPHKNLDMLLSAFKLLTINYPVKDEARLWRQPSTTLVIVCSRDVFWQRLKKKIEEMGLTEKVILTGYLKPKELAGILHKAEAYVFPSLSEGFGIPGLNAMAAGIPVIASDIPTLKEVYQSAALYFDPKNPKDIAEKISSVLQDKRLRSALIKKGNLQTSKYSWRKMAELTLNVYKSA